MSESYAATTKCESCPSPSWGKRFCESCTPPDAEAVARERAIAAVLACRDGLIVADVRDRELLSWVEAVERRVASAHVAEKLALLDALGPCAPEDEGRSIPDAIRALRAEVERLRECAAFVAALDAGEIVQFSGWGNAPDPRKFGIRVRGVGALDFGFGPDVLTAFRAAQDHLKGGPDDGQ